ncbi:MAG: hypothetical protein K0U72_04970 [Gammaproteobacteria bacterium]|nr:hypothetical protein [Gammaproteobacteria bacterium]
MNSSKSKARGSNSLVALSLSVLAVSWLFQSTAANAQTPECNFKWDGDCFEELSEAEAAMRAVDWHHEQLQFDTADEEGNRSYKVPPTPHLPPIAWHAEFFDGNTNPGFYGPAFATFLEAHTFMVDRAAVEGTSTELVHRGDETMSGRVHKFYSDNYTQVPITQTDLVAPYTTPQGGCSGYPNYSTEANVTGFRHYGHAPDSLVPWVVKPSIKYYGSNNCIQPDNSWYRIFALPVLEVAEIAVSLCKHPYYSDGTECVNGLTDEIEVVRKYVLETPTPEPADCDRTNPCDLATGNKLQSENDYAGSGAGTLSFSRFYNSAGPFRSTANGGVGWRHTYSRTLDERPDKDPIKFATGQSASYGSDLEACESGWDDIKTTVWSGDLSTATATFVGGSSCEISDGGSLKAIFPVKQAQSRPAFTPASTMHTITRPSGAVYHFKKVGSDWVNELNPAMTLEASGSNWVFSAASDTQETYNGSGQLISITYRNGQTETLEYNLTTAQGGDDDSDTLDRVTGPFGHSLSFAYDGSGRLDTVTTPDGAIQYGYDGNDNLISATQPDSSVRQYVYEDLDFATHLTGIIDENTDRYATWAYDTYGRAILSEHAGSQETVNIAYNSSGTTTLTLGNGATRTYTFATAQGRRRSTMITGDVCSTCPGGNIADRTYDANGFSDEIIDWNFNTTQTVRNSRGLTETLIEAKGSLDQRTTTSTWHADYRVPTQVVSPSNTTTFTHDSQGNVLTVTVSSGALSRGWTMTYNASGQLLTVDGPRTNVTDISTLGYYNCTTGNECGQLHTFTNALGQVTTYNSYDAAGRPTLVTDANGLQTALTYDWRGNVLSTTATPTSGTPRTMTMTYDNVGQLATLSTPDGRVLTYAYTAAHYVDSVTDNFGNKIQYAYDAMGNLADEDTLDSGSALKRAVDYVYDINNRLDSITSGGFETDLSLDLVGNLTSETDPGDFVTAYVYDTLNRLDFSTDALSGVTDYAYDAHDNVTQAVAPNGATTDFVYDALDNLTSEASPDRGTTTYTYDGAGNVATVTNALSKTATFDYDALNRVTSITYPNSAENVTYTYDDAATEGIGRLRSITDQSGSTTYSYNEFGEVITDARVMTGITYTTLYQYDAAGNVSAVTYPSGRVVDYVRNALGEITQVTSTKNSVAKTVISNATHAPFGPVETLTYGNGVVFNYQYGLDNRITSITSTGIADKHYSYDLAANISEIDDILDVNLYKSFDYDALRRIKEENLPQGGDYSAKILADNPVAYWRLGETSGTTAADSSGNSHDLTYTGTYTLGQPALVSNSDASMRIPTTGSGHAGTTVLTGVTVTGVETWYQTDSIADYRDVLSLHSTPYNRIILIHYKTDGRFKVWRGANQSPIMQSDSVVTTGEPHHVAVYYDAATNKTHMMIDGVVQQDTYSGNILAVPDPKVYVGALEHNNAPFSRFQGNIDEVAIYDGPMSASVFSNRTLSGADATFVYDANGNRTSYDDGSNVTSLTYASLSNQLATIDSVSITHDAAGNRTAEPGGNRTYTYSDSNRLTGVWDNSLSVAAYVHNAMGQRTRKTVGSTDTYFVYDLFGNLIAEHDGTGSLVRDYVWANGVPVAQVDSGEVFSYLHRDHLGTPRLATNDSQTVVWRWDSDAFGAVGPDEDPDGDMLAMTVNLRFPGQYYDSETGFYYNYFRTYDPSTGRYLESDPVGLGGGLNTYGYVRGNPLSAIDPYGLFDWPSLPQGIVDGAAGFGDGISSVFTLGLYSTADLRNDLGIDGGVDECSWAYRGSKYAGYGYGAATAFVGGLSGGANSVFWSGHGAEATAIRLGTTIGRTPVGRLANGVGLKSRRAWDFMSSIFARNATGNAQAVIRYRNSATTWNRIERPILKRRGIPIDYR